MAKISDNEKGNKYHDEKTGKFTSAGVSAVKDEVDAVDKLSDKEEKIKAEIAKFGNYYKYVNSINNVQDLNFLIDSYFSIPTLLNENKNLLKLILPNLKENKNKGLDKIGIDLISFDGDLSDLSIDNIYEKMNFIDVKTSFNDGVNINVMNLIDSGLAMDGLLNPNYKANNLFMFQMFDGLQGKTKRQIAKQLINTDLTPKTGVPSETYVIPKDTLYNAIYEYIGHDELLEGYNSLKEKIKKGANLEQITYELFSQEEGMHLYKDTVGILRGDMELGDGISLHVDCDTRNRAKPLFKVFVRLERNMIKSALANYKLTYANIKTNKIII